MKKRWIYSAIAGIALLTTACGNNATPDANRATPATPGTKTNAVPGTHPRTLTNTRDRITGVGDNYYRTAPNGAGTYSTPGTGTNRSDGFYGTSGTVGAGRTAGAGYAPTDGIFGAGHRRGDVRARGADDGYTSTYGTRGSVGYGAGLGSIYHDRHMSTAGVNHQIAQIGFVRMDSNTIRTASNAVNRVYVDRNALAHAVGAVTASIPGVQSSTVLVTDEEVFVGLHTGGASGGRTGGHTGGTTGGGTTGGATGGTTSGTAGGTGGAATGGAAGGSAGGTTGGTTTGTYSSHAAGHAGGQNATTVKSQARMSAQSVSPRYYKVYVTDDQRLIDQMARIARNTSHVRGSAPLDDRAYDPLIRSMGGHPDGEEMRTRGTGMNTNIGGTSGTSGNTGTTTRGTSR